MERIKLGPDGRVILPQPDDLSKKEKDDAMGAYLMMFAAWGIGLPLPFLSLIAALIYHGLNKKKSRYVAFHSYQSLLSETVISIINAVFIIWLVGILFSHTRDFTTAFYIYLVFTIFWNLVYTIASLVGCVKAKNGQFFYFLIFGQVAFNAYYGEIAIIRDRMAAENKPVNLPPDKF
jgi:uncharacterized Tic20 family protein